MIQINKDEKDLIKKKYPDIGVVRTVKQKSKRHRYYMEERRDAMFELRRIRGEIQDKRRNEKDGAKKFYGNPNSRGKKNVRTRS